MSNETALAELKGKRFPVLDDGHVILLDAMGSDADIAAAARVSFGKGTRKTSEDRDLIRYLYRHRHTSPFEMAEIKLAIRLPMDAMRQLVRHRTASINEYSTRYSEAIDAMQTTEPDAWRLQAKDNKQGSGGVLRNWTGEDGKPDVNNTSPEFRLDHAARITAKIPMAEPVSPGRALSVLEADFHRMSREVYQERLAMGVAREQARKDLPLSTYTEAIWKCDLRNVLGFLALRMDSHAQQEIRSYANIIGNEIVARLFPVTWQAFQDYTLGSVALTALDVKVIQHLDGFMPPVSENQFECAVEWSGVGWTGKRCRERDECKVKLIRLGLMKEGKP